VESVHVSELPETTKELLIELLEPLTNLPQINVLQVGARGENERFHFQQEVIQTSRQALAVYNREVIMSDLCIRCFLRNRALLNFM